MQHLEHDRLVFLALGEAEADSGETDHLGSCPRCRSELDTLRHVAGLGTETQALADLPEPPEHIWQAIAAEVAAAGSLPSLNGHRSAAALTGVDLTTTGAGLADDPQPAAPARIRPVPEAGRPTDDGSGRVVPLPAGPAVRAHGRGRPRRRWVATAVTAAAAVALGVVGTLVAIRELGGGRPGPTDPPVLATTTLSAYGDTPRAATGDARLLGDGRLEVHVANLPRPPGYYEVWLINPANMTMYSLGTLGRGSDAVLPLPPNLDLTTYRLVDVSAEAYDNKPAHSGDSLLRGTLPG